MSGWKKGWKRLWMSVAAAESKPAAVDVLAMDQHPDLPAPVDAVPADARPEEQQRILERQARSQRNWRYRAGPWQQK